MTETEFISKILDALKGDRQPQTALDNANAHKVVAIEGMLATVELGAKLDPDSYDLADEITHNMLSTLSTLLLEQSQLLRELIARTPEKVPFLPPKPQSPERTLLDDLLGRKSDVPVGYFKEGDQPKP